MIKIVPLLIGFLLLGCQREVALPPYPQSKIINGIELFKETHQRLAPGSDNWPVTWGMDDSQYLAWGDGGGFGGSNVEGRVSLGVARISRDENEYVTHNVFGGVAGDATATIDGKSYGILDVAGVFYMWISPGSDSQGYSRASLFVSKDQGFSWHDSGCFFDQNDGIIFPTFLQFGPGSSDSIDDYVYIYAALLKNKKSLAVQKPGEIILMRVKKNKLNDRSFYQFYSGMDESQNVKWANDIGLKVPVFFDQHNGVGWTVSVSFNENLNRYLLITEHSKSFNSNIGIYESMNPWGPWATVHFGKFPSGIVEDSCFFYNFSNKWTYGKGRRFFLFFTGVSENDSFNMIEGRFY